MKKFLFGLLLIVLANFAFAQQPSGVPSQMINSKWFAVKQYLSLDSGLIIGARPLTGWTPRFVGTTIINSADSLPYRWNGSQWVLFGTGGSFGVYNAGYGMQLVGNTFNVDSLLLSTKANSQKKIDSLAAQINGKANANTDIIAGIGLQGGGEIVSNINVSADTNFLSTKAFRTKGVDSIVSLLNNYVPLTRSVSTGYGFLGGGNLTTDRVLSADTSLLGTKNGIQKVADNINATKVPYTGATQALNLGGQNLFGAASWENAGFIYSGTRFQTLGNYVNDFDSTGLFNSANGYKFYAVGASLNSWYTPQPIVADKFIKIGGLSTEYLMADGSTTTIGGGGSFIENQSSSTQAATFNISGAGVVNNRFTANNTENIASSGSFSGQHANTLNDAGGSLTAGAPVVSTLSSFGYNLSTSRTVAPANVFSGGLFIARPNLSGSATTLTFDQASFSARAFSAVTAMFYEPSTASNTRTITHAAGLRTFLYPDNVTSAGRYNITNWYGVLIGATDDYAGSNITNRFGVYQEGASDINFFNGNVGVKTASPTAPLDINGNTIRLRTSKTPSSSTDTGAAGEICWDSDYIYICIATNTWKRVNISSAGW